MNVHMDIYLDKTRVRVKRWHRRHHHHNYDNDDQASDDDYGDGLGVAHLSYLTEKFGRDMSNDIDEGTHTVEDVGDEIERKGKTLVVVHCQSVPLIQLITSYIIFFIKKGQEIQDRFLLFSFI